MKRILRTHAVVFSLLGVLVLAGAIGGGLLAFRSHTTTSAPTADAQLSPEAVAVIARTLGRDDPTYHVKDLQASNDKQNYSARFTNNGVVFSPGFTLSVPGADYSAPSISENTVTYARDGYSEWYVNSPFGLEQGFILTKPSVIEISIADAEKLSLHKDKKGVDITTDSRTLSYQGLSAFDSTGKQLPTTFTKRTDTLLAINVNDTNAVYPITIDPFVQEQKLTASDGALSDVFGYSVSLSSDGTRAIVGAYADDIDANADQGSAYIFLRTGTSWAQEQKLTASDGALSDNFGGSVSLSSDGTRAIVSAPNDDIGANTDQGSAYIFLRTGTTWAQEQKLTASDGAVDDIFGYSVSLSSDGTRAIVSAPTDNIGANFNQGSAYVFLRTGTTWAQEQKLTASDGAVDDLFGFSTTLSSDGTRAIVSAPDDDGDANSEQGSAYVFLRTDTSWAQEQKLTASDGAVGDNFGRSVSLSSDGTRVIVGAYLDDIDANAEQGSAYVFLRTGTSWAQEQKLTASDGAADDNFGRSVSLSSDGTRAIVSAPNDDIGANFNQGSAYVFLRTDTTWAQEQQLTVSDGAEFDIFGYSIFLSSDGTRAIVGAYLDDIDANTEQGSAYVFLVNRQLSVTFAGTGTGIVTSDIAGIDCTTDCSAPFDPGTVVTLTATPDAKMTFAGWTGDADCVDGTVTMSADISCTATFNEQAQGGSSGSYISPEQLARLFGSPTPTPLPTPSPSPIPSVTPSPSRTPTPLPLTSGIPAPVVTPSPNPTESPLPTASTEPFLTPSPAEEQRPPQTEQFPGVSDTIIRAMRGLSSAVTPVAVVVTALISILIFSSIAVSSAAAGMIGFLASTTGAALSAIGLKRRRRVWGVVYDSHTKVPIPYAKVELRDSSNRVLETRYANQSGQYGFLTSPASLNQASLRFSLLPSARGFTFPSTKVTGDPDFIVYDHVYHGGQLELSGNTLANNNLPMDPVSATPRSLFSRPFLSGATIGILDVAFWIGLVATPINAYLHPSALSVGILVIFLGVNAVRSIADLYKPFGVIADSATNKPLSYALVTLNDLTGRRISFAVSDERGRYLLSANPGSYTLTVYTPAQVAPQRSRSLPLTTKKGWVRTSLRI